MSQVTIHTDGSCVGNPGPGGYAAILQAGQHRREVVGGFRYTTNSRMELIAVIEGLRALKRPCRATIYSDSQYVVHAVQKGWLDRWVENGWRKANRKRVENTDLWKQLVDLLAQHEVRFIWVQGHAGIAENERADELAFQASLTNCQPADAEYERKALPMGLDTHPEWGKVESL